MNSSRKRSNSCCCWRRFGWGDAVILQRPMHPLMAAVLLGLPWFDPHRGTAEVDPPLRQLGQPSQRAGRRKRRPVVRDDLHRDSVVAENVLEHRLGQCRGRGGTCRNVEHVTAHGLNDGQGVAITAVAHSKLSLVVGRHRMSRPRNRERRMFNQPGSTTPRTALLDHAVSGQNLPSRARRKKMTTGLLFKHGHQLCRPVVRVFRLQLQ